MNEKQLLKLCEDTFQPGILLNIFSFLPLKSLAKLECVSKNFQGLLKEKDGLWESHYHQTLAESNNEKLYKEIAAPKFEEDNLTELLNSKYFAALMYFQINFQNKKSEADGYTLRKEDPNLIWNPLIANKLEEIGKKTYREKCRFLMETKKEIQDKKVDKTPEVIVNISSR